MPYDILNEIAIRRVLVSVSNKEGIVPLCQLLWGLGAEIISTGGTKKILEKASIPVTSITELTHNPEAFSGRVKTLSFQVASALLFRRDHSEDKSDAKRLGIKPIDLVICNLYPFEQAICDKKTDLDELIEKIDIGGSTMVRAAAKNFYSVGVVTDPNQYPLLMKELGEKQTLSLVTRKKLSLKAFKLSAHYDTLISEYLEELDNQEQPGEPLAPTLSYHRDPMPLRYGENPQQRASFYRSFQIGIAHAEKIQGKELSYNNLLDAEAAWKAAGDVARIDSSLVAVSIIKHMGPCGIACHENLRVALEDAWAADSTSAFGGIIATTVPVEESSADFISKKFIEVLIAPSITEEARAKLAHKKNLRILIYPNYSGHREIVMRSISGGLLVQEEDFSLDQDFKIVTKNKLIQKDYRLCQFATTVGKYLKSNAIVIVAPTGGEGMMLVGAGGGQPNRIDSFKKLAWPRAREMTSLERERLVVSSDAFFPFPDIIQAFHEVGIKNIIQTGGSVKDREVIDEADRYDLSMAFTGRRHFRH